MRIMTLEGKDTTQDDPERGIWYGASGCTYWTDDWDKVTQTIPKGGIPRCPECGMVGFQVTAKEWFDGAAKYQADGHPGYLNFLNQSKEQCKRREGLNFMTWFKQWLIEHPNGRNDPSPRSDGS